MICDGEGNPMCIGGVYGGLNSGVSDATTAIFLEAAHFNAGDHRFTRFGLEPLQGAVVLGEGFGADRAFERRLAACSHFRGDNSDWQRDAAFTRRRGRLRYGHR